MPKKKIASQKNVAIFGRQSGNETGYQITKIATFFWGAIFFGAFRALHTEHCTKGPKWEAAP